MTKIRFIHLSAQIGRRTNRLADGNMDEKRRTLSHGTLDGDKTAVFLHDLVGHR